MSDLRELQKCGLGGQPAAVEHRGAQAEVPALRVTLAVTAHCSHVPTAGLSVYLCYISQPHGR